MSSEYIEFFKSRKKLRSDWEIHSRRVVTALDTVSRQITENTKFVFDLNQNDLKLAEVSRLVCEQLCNPSHSSSI